MRAVSLWHDGTPVFLSELRPFHPLFFLPASLLFFLGIAMILFSGWRFVRDPRRARFYELTIVTTLALLGTAPRMLPFVLLAAALPALRFRSALASLALAALLAAPWWMPGVEAMQHPNEAVRGSFRFAPLAATDHVPAKIAGLAGELPQQLRGGRVEAVGDLRARVRSDGWNLLASPHAWWPGWRVYVNGERMPPVRVDGRFAGTFVPPGEATIEFRYRPRTFDLGLRASALGLILLLAWPWLERIRIRIPLERIAIAALVLYAAILIAHRCGVAGGADSSGYLNQARLWRSGTLSLEVPSEKHIPLGFVKGTRPNTMVPSYPPGLPLHMALLGDRGSAFLSPLAAIGCLLLLVRIARELGIDHANALAAAMILALSPVFIFQSLQPMSDVVSTFWALVCVWCAIRGRERTSFAIAAGVAFGIGVLVRPTHVLLFPAMLALLGLRVRTLAAFAAGGAPFALFQFALANHWYGSPLKSGYGSITESLGLRFFPTRFVHYTKWLAILFPLAFPFGLLKKRIALLLWFLPFFLFYCVYEPYETWWYTRFLLPAIPAVLLLAASFRIPRAALLTMVVAIAAMQLVTAHRFHVLDVAKGEATYERAALLAKQHVPRDATILASQHSGALLFYAEHLALRFDMIDSSSEALGVLGVPRSGAPRGTPRTSEAPEELPALYALVSDYELPALKQRVPGEWTAVARTGDTTLLRLP